MLADTAMTLTRWSIRGGNETPGDHVLFLQQGPR